MLNVNIFQMAEFDHVFFRYNSCTRHVRLYLKLCCITEAEQLKNSDSSQERKELGSLAGIFLTFTVHYGSPFLVNHFVNVAKFVIVLFRLNFRCNTVIVV